MFCVPLKILVLLDLMNLARKDLSTSKLYYKMWREEVSQIPEVVAYSQPRRLTPKTRRTGFKWHWRITQNHRHLKKDTVLTSFFNRSQLVKAQLKNPFSIMTPRSMLPCKSNLAPLPARLRNGTWSIVMPIKARIPSM